MITPAKPIVRLRVYTPEDPGRTGSLPRSAGEGARTIAPGETRTDQNFQFETRLMQLDLDLFDHQCQELLRDAHGFGTEEHYLFACKTTGRRRGDGNGPASTGGNLQPSGSLKFEQRGADRFPADPKLLTKPPLRRKCSAPFPARQLIRQNLN